MKQGYISITYQGIQYMQVPQDISDEDFIRLRGYLQSSGDIVLVGPKTFTHIEMMAQPHPTKDLPVVFE